MPEYKPHPEEKTTHSRKTRKGERNKVFLYNFTLVRKLKKERRKKRQEEAELATMIAEEENTNA
jgi:hypothetical protein